MARRRVGLGEACKMALKGMENASGNDSWPLVPAYALYWWIFGVPEDWKKV